MGNSIMYQSGKMVKFPVAVLFLFLLVSSLPIAVHAAEKKSEKKPVKEVKKETREAVVLMPLRPTKDIPQDEMTQYEAALKKGLSDRYVVYAGEQVQNIVKDVYRKRSGEAKAGHECDETKCIQDIAIAFQAELVAIANIRKSGGGYSISLTINNVMDDKLVLSEQKSCKGCDEFGVADVLKTIAGVVAPPAAEAPAAQAVMGAGTEDKESLYWNSIKDSTNPDDFAAYLQDYPKGTFASLAKSRMAALKKTAAQTQVAPAKEVDAGSRSTSELDIWKSVKDSINPDDLSLYLQAFPNGAFSVTAKNRIEALKKDAAKKAAAEKAAAEKAAAERANAEKVAAEKAVAEEAARVAIAKKAAAEKYNVDVPPPVIVQTQPPPQLSYRERIAAEKAAAEKEAAERAVADKVAAEKFVAMKANPPEGMVAVERGSGGFFMDKTEVTQEAYQRIIGNNPSEFKGCSTCPVENVNWNEADAYCKKVGKRLPTEQEWEYAATSGGKGETYAGTSDESSVGDYAWFKDNSDKKTHPVGEKKPNGLGLYDMSGNVWEWTDSWYDGSKKYRVLRGGSWYGGASGLRAAYRFYTTPVLRIDINGFRCSQ